MFNHVPLATAKRARRQTRFQRDASNQRSLTHLTEMQLRYLKKYREALERLGNHENWAAGHDDTLVWLGESGPLTIAQEALEYKGQEEKKDGSDDLSREGQSNDHIGG